jgi:hypothetical protein
MSALKRVLGFSYPNIHEVIPY